jgi:transcriptional regulator with XRE-family HTH domain
MNVTESWSEYVRRVARGLTQAQIAEKMGGIAASNIGRWLRGEPGMPRADSVIAFARAFGQPPLEAMTAAGYFTEGDVTTSRTPLSAYAMGELIDELRRRTVTD